MVDLVYFSLKRDICTATKIHYFYLHNCMYCWLLIQSLLNLLTLIQLSLCVCTYAYKHMHFGQGKISPFCFLDCVYTSEFYYCLTKKIHGSVLLRMCRLAQKFRRHLNDRFGDTLRDESKLLGIVLCLFGK